MDSIEFLAQTLQIKPSQVQAVLQLLEEGATIPFIARYRKEKTGNLNEEVIRQIEQQYAYQENLKERKEDVIRLIEEKGLLTPEVKSRIEACTKLAEVEDIYRPYKEKKHTKASAALEAGLGPLADAIRKPPKNATWDTLLAPYREKTGMSDDQLKENAGYIIAQQISDNPDNRNRMKKWILKNGTLTSKLKKDVEDTKYQIYHDFSSSFNKLKPHQILAINRAEKEKIITVSIDLDNDEAMAKLLPPNQNRYPLTKELVSEAAKDGWKRLLFPSLQREIRRDYTETAEGSAIDTFKSNLENLLMTRPLGATRVLGFDPAFRTGCKLAVLDEQGNVEHIGVIYPHTGKAQREEAKMILANIIRDFRIQYIAIGNGTASRESEAFVAEVLKQFPDVKYAIVSEAGASVYSASKLAIEEFPDLTVEKRSAVSIGRRIQDPLSELVKIDPKSIGIGEYQHDVNQKQLSEALDFVTEKVVNNVGVNVNTASPSILKYVSGMNKPAITKLIAARKETPITSRAQIAQIKGISDKIYEQSIGFIRVPESKNLLDHTGIHPESYGTAMKILDELGLDIKDMRTPAFETALKKASPGALVKKTGSDMYTVMDILSELIHPGLDPRDSLDGPILKSDILKYEDLKVGMALEGTVRNVTSFGAFIDIGLHNDGLVHISKMASHYVKDPKDVVSVGDIVTCYVLDVNPKTEKVSLSLLPQA